MIRIQTKNSFDKEMYRRNNANLKIIAKIFYLYQIKLNFILFSRNLKEFTDIFFAFFKSLLVHEMCFFVVFFLHIVCVIQYTYKCTNITKRLLDFYNKKSTNILR